MNQRACVSDQQRPRAGEVWLGSCLSGPLAYDLDGRARQTHLFSQIDVATGFVIRSEFTHEAEAEAHEYGLRQAVLTHGVPRIYLVDRGPVFSACSLQVLCERLGIQLVMANPYAPSWPDLAESVQRQWRRRVRRAAPRTTRLADLNALFNAWCERTYNNRKHPVTGRPPMRQWDAERRPRVSASDLREERVVDLDGAFSFRGELYQVGLYLAHRTVELRVDPATPEAIPQVFLDGRFLCNPALVPPDDDEE
jgi:hypothetical protein